MSTTQEAPALIQYACERCKTRFVLPPSSRKLSLTGKLRALSMGLSRTFRYHEGLGSSYDTTRRQLLAKMDDEAYQAFVQSFRFCHECRQFVCNECWSMSRRSCLSCVAKSMTGTVRPRPPFAPTGPEIPRPVIAAAAPSRRGRLRRDAAMVALGLALVFVVLEGGYLLYAANSNATPTPPTIFVTEAPSATATATPTPAPTAEPTTAPTEVAPIVTPVPTPVPTPIASAVATATPTAKPTPTPTPTPKKTATPTAPPPVITPAPVVAPTPVPPPPVITPAPVVTPTPVPTPLPNPVVTCPSRATPGVNFTCTWQHWTGGADSTSWQVEDSSFYLVPGQMFSTDSLTTNLPAGTYTIVLTASRGGEPLVGMATITVY